MLFVVVAIVLFASIPAFAGAASASVGSGVIQETVNLRTGPGVSYSSIAFLKTGETVTVLEQPNSYWLKVKTSKAVVGYISSQSKYVKQSSTPNPAPTPAPSDENAVIVSSVSFRKLPSTNGERIRYLKKDERVTVTAKHNSYWYAVKDASGVSGYISTSAQYVKLTGNLPSLPVTPSQPGGGNTSQPSDAIEQVIAAGLRYLGKPYEYGSKRDETTTFDCSDFVRQAFRDALNLVLPADSRKQGDYVRQNGQVTTDWRSLQRGDLMFFMSYKGTSASLYSGKQAFKETISHTGIYLGNGQILHTYSKESGGVRIDTIAGKHWEHRFLYGGSAL